MKNLPNYLTAANLLCGCIAIVLIVGADPYVSETSRWIILQDQEVMMGSVFILVAALFDLLDGAAARGLQIFSPIGKYLDSLADVVSFGVAPSMIVYRGLWESFMNRPDSLDISMVWLVPAFFIAVGAAWRLATYDAIGDQHEKFLGLPVPSTGLFIASIPLIYAFGQPPSFIDAAILSPIFWYVIIFLFTYLMNSKVEFTKSRNLFIPFTGKYNLFILILFGLILVVFFGEFAIPIAIFTYIFVHFMRWLIKP